MRFSEIDGDCDLCPLKEEGMCPGGYSSDGRGNPIEPPCVQYDEDDVDVVISKIEEVNKYWAHVEKEKFFAEEEVRYKKERQEYLKYVGYSEKREIRKKEKAIAKINGALSSRKSLIGALTITDAMFTHKQIDIADAYKDDEQDTLWKSRIVELEAEIKNLKESIANLRKKARSKIGYHRAGCRKKPVLEEWKGCSWYENCLVFESPKTRRLADRCNSDLLLAGCRNTDSLVYFIKEKDGYYYLYSDSVSLGYLDNNRGDKLYKDYVKSVVYDIGFAPDVIILPGKYFIPNRTICYERCGEFRKACVACGVGSVV